MTRGALVVENMADERSNTRRRFFREPVLIAEEVGLLALASAFLIPGIWGARGSLTRRSKPFFCLWGESVLVDYILGSDG